MNKDYVLCCDFCKAYNTCNAYRDFECFEHHLNIVET